MRMSLPQKRSFFALGMVTIQESILTELLQIEKKEDLTILLAVESGSRA